MKIEQLRILCEIVDQGLSMSRAASAMDMSQPNISKQVRLLEEHLAVDLLLRRGGRIVGLTEPGAEAIKVARRIVREADNLKNIGEDYKRGDRGRLTIATTHFIARYLLPDCIEQFHQHFPKVQITLQETTQRHALDMLQSTEADVAILSEPPSGGVGVVQLPTRGVVSSSLVAPADHPILSRRPLTLEAIARHPLVQLDPHLSGGWNVKRAFEKAGLHPNVAMTTTNIEIVKAYVARGLGVAVLPSLCVEKDRDPDLGALDVSHLIPSMPHFIALHPESSVRGYVYDFIEAFTPEWTRRRVGRRMRQSPD